MDRAFLDSQIMRLRKKAEQQLGTGWKIRDDKLQALDACPIYLERFCASLEKQFAEPAPHFLANVNDRTFTVVISCAEATIYGENDPFLELVCLFNVVEFVQTAMDQMEIRLVLQDVWEEAN
jgi:hypothetical protein